MDYYISLVQKNLAYTFSLLKKNVASKYKVGVLASGGIDSSVIAYYATRYFANAELLSFGTFKSKDLPFIEILKNYLAVNHQYLVIEDNDIKNNLHTVNKILIENGIEPNLMQRSLALGYFLIFKKAQTLNIKYVLTGQGPDVLLAGYSKYKRMNKNEINTEILKDINALEIDKKRDQAMADHFGIKLINPYLEKTFIDLSLQIPLKYKLVIKEGRWIEKLILRELGKKIGLPDEIVHRPKMAFQYSTGIQKAISKCCLYLPAI